MINNDRITILKGDLVEAEYKKQEIEEYEYNPFIEALPPIFTIDDLADNFYLYPKISEEDRNKPSNLRYHIIKRVKNFLQPLPVHFDIEIKLSSLIRRGYLLGIL